MTVYRVIGGPTISGAYLSEAVSLCARHAAGLRLQPRLGHEGPFRCPCCSYRLTLRAPKRQLRGGARLIHCQNKQRESRWLCLDCGEVASHGDHACAFTMPAPGTFVVLHLDRPHPRSPLEALVQVGQVVTEKPLTGLRPGEVGVRHRSIVYATHVRTMHPTTRQADFRIDSPAAAADAFADDPEYVALARAAIAPVLDAAFYQSRSGAEVARDLAATLCARVRAAGHNWPDEASLLLADALDEVQKTTELWDISSPRLRHDVLQLLQLRALHRRRQCLGVADDRSVALIGRESVRALYRRNGDVVIRAIDGAESRRSINTPDTLLLATSSEAGLLGLMLVFGDTLDRPDAPTPRLAHLIGQELGRLLRRYGHEGAIPAELIAGALDETLPRHRLACDDPGARDRCFDWMHDLHWQRPAERLATLSPGDTVFLPDHAPHYGVVASRTIFGTDIRLVDGTSPKFSPDTPPQGRIIHYAGSNAAYAQQVLLEAGVCVSSVPA